MWFYSESRGFGRVFPVFPVSREFCLPVQAGKALENGNFGKLLPGFIGTIPGVALGRDGKGEVWDEGKSSNSLKIQQD